MRTQLPHMQDADIHLLTGNSGAATDRNQVSSERSLITRCRRC